MSRPRGPRRISEPRRLDFAGWLTNLNPNEGGTVPEYTIERVVGVEEWEGKFGPMKTWTVEIAGEGEVQINQKPETPAPAGTVAGTISENDYGKKLKKEKPQGSFGGGGRSPQENRKIVRQHSQHTAVALLTLAAQLKKTPDETWELVSKVASWLDGDVEKAGA